MRLQVGMAVLQRVLKRVGQPLPVGIEKSGWSRNLPELQKSRRGRALKPVNPFGEANQAIQSLVASGLSGDGSDGFYQTVKLAYPGT